MGLSGLFLFSVSLAIHLASGPALGMAAWQLIFAPPSTFMNKEMRKREKVSAASYRPHSPYRTI